MPKNSKKTHEILKAEEKYFLLARVDLCFILVRLQQKNYFGQKIHNIFFRIQVSSHPWLMETLDLASGGYDVQLLEADISNI